jgi:hypothetical protein
LVSILSAVPANRQSAKILNVRLIHRCVAAMPCLRDTLLERMKEETERIWSPLDVSIVWRDPQVPATTVQDGGLVVMVEDAAYPKWAVDHAALLAGVHPSDDACAEGLAHVWVRNVERYVAGVHRDGQSFSGFPKAFADVLLGRALGRALAHEIGHYLLGTAEHSTHGLMRASFAPQDLLEPAMPRLYGLSAQQRASLVSCRTVRASDRAF